MSAIYPRRDVASEHRAIMDAAIAGDTVAAIAAMEQHCRRTAAIVTDAGLGNSVSMEDE